MVSINTNLSSLIVQGNLTNSTNGLNKAVERLSTGYKINHAGDNAANYSIANKYEAKLSSYDVAADNITMGMDLLSVAQDTISTMQNHGARLQALITQARNGTYGAQSLNALTQEAGAIISEIQRMYTNTEYNGINLFDNFLPEWAKEVKANAGVNAGVNLEPKYDGFIENAKTYTDEEVASMTKVADVESFTSGQKYSISSKEELQKLATKVNSGTNTTNVEFVLANDIDLSSIENWDAIGTDYSHEFKGTFDGNGHVIKNLKIEKSTTNYQGLFGYTDSGSTVKNVGVVDCDIKGKNYTGGLVGCADENSTITNSYATGDVTGNNYTGGLVGMAYTNSTITNSYATGNVNGNDYTGGLVGCAYGTVTNSYATGNVNGNDYTGGLVGYTEFSTVTNSYATGDVTGTGWYTGGLAGYAYYNSTVTNSYATGDVNGEDCTGGLVGAAYENSTVTNSYATGNVNGKSLVGGLVGWADGTITNSYAAGDVKGTTFVGGLVGEIYSTSGTLNYDKLFSSGKVSGDEKLGSLIGGIANTSNGTSFGTINITNAKVVNHDMNVIGFEGMSDGTACESGQMASWLENIKEVAKPETNLQVGIMGNEASRISFDTGFEYDLNAILSDISSDKAYSTITKFMSTLSEKATDLGAASNRLESALDSVLVNMENLTSSLSTVKDVDMAQESSQYIRMQILQQASATLLATANQSPSIALQLI